MAQKKKLDKKLVEKLAGVVLVVDDKDDTVYEDPYRRFATQEQAVAYKDGMEAAWELSRGPYVPDHSTIHLLGDAQDFADWDDAGTPGLEKVIDLL